MKKITHYLITFLFLLGIDLVWISLVMNKMYQEVFSGILRTNPIVWSAVFAWILIPLGIVMFTVPISRNANQSISYGALYGLILYGVYDFTNYAVLSPYTLKMTLLDIAWGTCICSITSVFSWKIKKIFF
ncbi:DUF2177 family protein [Candidatus Woesearchaeota archaeon]|nr:DUF2177 family protein [Candidatus Woesearchaeota archaeon]